MPEPRLDYIKITHKAEAGFSIEAPSLERLYINAALALTDSLVSMDRIGDQERRTIVVQAESKESLMVAWLNRVLLELTQTRFLCRRIIFEKFDGKQIRATLRGEIYSPLRHGHVENVKGVVEPVEMGEQYEPTIQFFTRVFLNR